MPVRVKLPKGFLEEAHIYKPPKMGERMTPKRLAEIKRHKDKLKAIKRQKPHRG